MRKFGTLILVRPSVDCARKINSSEENTSNIILLIVKLLQYMPILYFHIYTASWFLSRTYCLSKASPAVGLPIPLHCRSTSTFQKLSFRAAFPIAINNPEFPNASSLSQPATEATTKQQATSIPQQSTTRPPSQSRYSPTHLQ